MQPDTNQTKLEKGFWDKAIDRAPKVTFEVDKTVTLIFTGEPDEKENVTTGSVYYNISVTYNGVDTIIQTSAITLLGELAKHAPLTGQTLSITKRQDKGKQKFQVEVIS